MRIDSTRLVLTSSSESSVVHTREERLRTWGGTEAPAGASVTLSPEARDALAAGAAAAPEVQSCGCGDEAVKIGILERMLEELTGRPCKIRPVQAEQLRPSPGSAPVPRGGWGLSYDKVEQLEVHESMTFSARGKVRTADGREICVSVDLAMRRDLVVRREEHLRLGAPEVKDPLILDLTGGGARLGPERVSLDLDLDGREEQIATVAPGAGFLAVDLDGDGTVSDGSELFGPRTGDGFAELAEHDEDHNGWIDEGDSVFDRLRIWTTGTRLLSLRDAGIGAISLGNVTSRFRITDPAGEQLGQVDSTGIWLGEDGTAGVIQHVDLVV
jgi:hypothetical protein